MTSFAHALGATFDHPEPLPQHSLGRVDPTAGTGLIGERFGGLPVSVWPVDPNSPEERLLRRYVGDTGQSRVLGTHFADSRNDASIFSPVVAKRLVLGYTRLDELVIDPFAGGGARAIMTAEHGRRYVGVDVRPAEVDRVNARLAKLALDSRARVILGDATAFDWSAHVEEGSAALVLTCPPYLNLERYSDDPADLSNAPNYATFLAAIEKVIRRVTPALRPGAFSAWVLGDVVHPATNEYLVLPDEVSRILRHVGFRSQGRIILDHGIGLAHKRVGQFDQTRRPVRIHEEVRIHRWLTNQGEPSMTTTMPSPIAPAAEVTPIERHGDFWLKRDDLYEFAGVNGGKVRTCETLARRAVVHGYGGLVTAGSRSSPQVNIVAHIARELGLGARAHVPWATKKPLGSEVLAAQEAGAEIIQERPGHNSVIKARARDDAAALGWFEIPFGMECEDAVEATAAQVPDQFPDGVQRLVVPVGSAMSLAGILSGLRARNIEIPVLGVVVGANPKKLLAKWAPGLLGQDVELVDAGVPYDKHVTAEVGGVPLDPVYEAKCFRFLRPGDLLWIVGHRATA